MKLHAMLDQIKTEYEASHRAQLAELVGVQALLEDLGILQVLDHITDTNQLHITQDYFYQGPNTPGRPADRYWIKIRLPVAIKPKLRRFLVPLFDLQDKRYFVDKLWTITHDQDQLIEEWTRTWDRVAADNNHSAWNSLTIHWYRPAIEGEHITDTCTVATVTEETQASQRTKLSIVCSKAGR